MIGYRTSFVFTSVVRLAPSHGVGIIMETEVLQYLEGILMDRRESRTEKRADVSVQEQIRHIVLRYKQAIAL